MGKNSLIGLTIALLGLAIFGGVKPIRDNAPESPAPTDLAVQPPSDSGPTAVTISIHPEKIIQGDPALVVVNGTTSVKSLSVDGKVLPVFFYSGKLAALMGIDLRGRIGNYPIKITLTDGREINSVLRVGERTIAKAPLGIPPELGGDTPEAEKELINTLIQEGAIISAIPVSKEKLWSGKFAYPLKGEIVITDTYGYSRLTGASTISHKGTDFRASVGTPVYAMNDGIVRFTRNLRNYGNTIAIDHGTGILTIYMHLSEIDVEVGEKIEKGDLIGKSGATGYVIGPHLHLTIRINGISIDPEKFLELFGENA